MPDEDDFGNRLGLKQCSCKKIKETQMLLGFKTQLPEVYRNEITCIQFYILCILKDTSEWSPFLPVIVSEDK